MRTWTPCIAVPWTKRDWYPPNPAPPQAQCNDPDPHDRHMFEGKYALVWSCQGRRPKKIKQQPPGGVA